MYLFFDTETTGLPKNWKAPVSDSFNWPRMVQIAWQVYDDSGNCLSEASCIIKPEGYTIPAQVAKVHRITTNRANKEGEDLKKVLELFAGEVKQNKFLVAHNISFDEKILGAEFYRKELPNPFYRKKKLCTMKTGTNYCCLPGPRGYKWPKLSELHIALFNEDFEEAHDAMADIQATARCFWKMRDLNII